jgi:hypothetical protein
MSGDTTESFLPTLWSPAEIAEASSLAPSGLTARSAAIPLRYPVNGYTHYEYTREKQSGLRRANGARKLKRLSSRHLKIISNHLAGMSGELIASSMNITVVTVSRILNDPLAKEYLDKIYESRRQEIDALAGNAIDAVRQGLDSESGRERLMAVDKFTKLKDSIGTTADDAMTAEDVIAKMFSKLEISDSNVQINLGESNGRRSGRTD